MKMMSTVRVRGEKLRKCQGEKGIMSLPVVDGVWACEHLGGRVVGVGRVALGV